MTWDEVGQIPVTALVGTAYEIEGERWLLMMHAGDLIILYNPVNMANMHIELSYEPIIEAIEDMYE